MLKLKRLKILHYRNVKPGCELSFDDGLNLVLGKNASGKTTLLALLSAVCRSVFEGIKHEEFELEYTLSNDAFSVEAKVSHRQVPTTDDEQQIGAGPLWDDHYETTFTDLLTGEELSIDSERASRHRRVDLIMEWSFIAALLSNRTESWTDLRNELFRSFGSAFRFDESLDCFASMTGRQSVLGGPESPPLARKGYTSRRGLHVTDGEFIPPSLSNALGHVFRLADPDADLSVDDAAKNFTDKAATLMDVQNVVVKPRVTERRITSHERSISAEGFTFEVTRPDGTTIHHDRLSYGQKRLLSFLYYLECNPSVVIADELVNGLHHRWIDACMKEIGSRQAFLTSQNPLLFDYADFESVEQVMHRFIVCDLEMVDDREMLVWRNMSHGDAEVFFRAYEAGIEHVGDILITRGLW